MSVPQGVIKAVNAFRAANDAMGSGLSKIGEAGARFAIKRVNQMGNTATRMANGAVTDQDIAMIGGLVGPVDAVQSFRRVVKPATFDAAREVVEGSPQGMQGMTLDDVMQQHNILDKAKAQQLLPHEMTAPDALDIVGKRLNAYQKSGNPLTHAYIKNGTDFPLETPSDAQRALTPEANKIWNSLVKEVEIPISQLKRGEGFQSVKVPGRKITRPIEVNGDGLILDGHNRVNQAIANGDKTIKAKIMPWRGEFEQKLRELFESR